MKQKTVYKVVREDMTSAMAKEWNIRVQYVPGKWVKPQIEGSELFAFSQLRYAQQFKRRYRQILCLGQIWEAQAKDVHRRYRLYLYYHELQDVVLFWKRKRQGKRVRYWMEAPPGTVSAKALKLVKRVA